MIGNPSALGGSPVVNNVLRQRKIRQFKGAGTAEVGEKSEAKRGGYLGRKAKEDVVALQLKEANFEGLGSNVTLNPVSSQKIIYPSSKSLLMNYTQGSTHETSITNIDKSN